MDTIIRDQRRKFRVFALCFSLFLSITIVAFRLLSSVKDPDFISLPDSILFLPKNGLGPFPLLIALSPSADAEGITSIWKGVAAKHGWAILASKTFKNGIDPERVYDRLEIEMPSLSERYKLDKNRIIATGFSGGAWGSHQLACHYPELVRGIIVNTGKMPPDCEELGDRYPRGKIAVFLASPNDFRYREMKDDESLLRSYAWQTLWLEFSGGHTFAPDDARERALEWAENLMR